MRSTADLTGVIRNLRAPAGCAPTDPELLDRYARRHDQEAFATLVRRYGPLVLGVARRQVAERDYFADPTKCAHRRCGCRQYGTVTHDRRRVM